MSALEHKGIVLTADDDPVTTQILLAYLEGSGFEVVTADDGDQAIDVASRVTPDAVILDYNLPPTTGAEVARRLRAEAATAEVSIALLTASIELADSPDEAELWNARLSKPIDQALLTQVVESMVAATRAARESAGAAGPNADEDPLRTEFLSRLRSKIAGLRDLAAALDDSLQPGSPMRVLRRQLGQLQGSADMCGAPEVGQIASDTVQRIERCMGPGVIDIDRELDAVKDAIEEIARLAGAGSASRINAS